MEDGNPFMPYNTFGLPTKGSKKLIRDMSDKNTLMSTSKAKE